MSCSEDLLLVDDSDERGIGVLNDAQKLMIDWADAVAKFSRDSAFVFGSHQCWCSDWQFDWWGISGRAILQYEGHGIFAHQHHPLKRPICGAVVVCHFGGFCGFCKLRD